MRLGAALDAHVSRERLGKVYIAPLDAILSNSTIVQPDILFIATDRAHVLSSRGLEGAPTLAVEILSPSTGRIDRQTKMQLYAHHGVPFYWIVDCDARTIDVYRQTANVYGAPVKFSGEDLIDLPPFPGLRLDPVTLWPSDGP